MEDITKTTKMALSNYHYKIASSIGGRGEQQDFYGSANTKFGLLVVVCDGMGGAKGGATASNMAVNIILQDIATANYSSPALALFQSINKANQEIYNRSRLDENYRGMGTTVTAILLQKEKATVAHVGDSRIYQLRNPDWFGKSMQKIFRTNDHSKVFELVKRGILNEEQARISDESNIILRALGIKPEVDVEVKDNIPYLKNDRFLLCTDGVSGAIPEHDLLKILNQKSDVESTVNQLISTIDQTGYTSGGGHDNLTAALIECNTNSTLKPKINMKTTIIIAALSLLLLTSIACIAYLKFGNKTKNDPDDIHTLKESMEHMQTTIDSLKNANSLLIDSLAQSLAPTSDQNNSNSNSYTPRNVSPKELLDSAAKEKKVPQIPHPSKEDKKEKDNSTQTL